MELKVTGTVHNVDVEPDMPLLWALREELGLTGTKHGCGVAQCGACSAIHLRSALAARPSAYSSTGQHNPLFAKEAYQLIPAAERPKSLALGLRAPSESANRPEQRGTPEAVAAALGFITNADLDYDSWVRIGMAIKGALAEAGWPLFEAWSATSVKNDSKTTAKSWSSLAPQRIGAGTIYKLALDQGWVPAQDLQLNGEVVMNGHHPAKPCGINLVDADGAQMPLASWINDSSAEFGAIKSKLNVKRLVPTGP